MKYKRNIHIKQKVQGVDFHLSWELDPEVILQIKSARLWSIMGGSHSHWYWFRVIESHCRSWQHQHHHHHNNFQPTNPARNRNHPCTSSWFSRIWETKRGAIFRKFLSDIHSPWFDHLAPYYAFILPHLISVPNPLKTDTWELKITIDILQPWDGTYTSDSKPHIDRHVVRTL